jgi:hypothetical protein
VIFHSYVTVYQRPLMVISHNYASLPESILHFGMEAAMMHGHFAHHFSWGTIVPGGMNIMTLDRYKNRSDSIHGVVSEIGTHTEIRFPHLEII